MSGPYRPPTWLAAWETDYKGHMRFSLRHPEGDGELCSVASTVPATGERPPGSAMLRHLGLGSVPGSAWEWECERSRWVRHVFPLTEAAEKAILGRTMDP